MVPAEAPDTPKDDKKKRMEQALKAITDAEALDNSNSDCHRWSACVCVRACVRACVRVCARS